MFRSGLKSFRTRLWQMPIYFRAPSQIVYEISIYLKSNGQTGIEPANEMLLIEILVGIPALIFYPHFGRTNQWSRMVSSRLTYLYHTPTIRYGNLFPVFLGRFNLSVLDGY